MMTKPTTLYIRDNSGKIRFWAISVDGCDIVMEYGVLGGAIQEKREEVLEGKAGRTLDEQIMLQVASRISSKRDEGYSHKIEDANKKATNAQGLRKPMLAKKYQDVTIPAKYDLYRQWKYDGHRCLVTKQAGVVRAYSRNGKPITTINHILRSIPILEGETLDGELYCHGEPLQRISSWVKRSQEDSLRLEYIIYDIMLDLPYHERLSKLVERPFKEPCRVAPTEAKTALERDIGSLKIGLELREALDLGYEGLILRWGNEGYQDGKRAKQLVKVKAWHDDEFIVTDIKASSDGWAILICDCKGKPFSVSAPGSIPEKEEVWTNKENYIGRKVTVEYANLTAGGIPFHPVARHWRDKE